MIEGYAVQTAANGAEALDCVRQKLPAAIVLDLMMPIMDGWTFARECHKLVNNAVPILVLSAAPTLPQTTEELHALGVRACLAKPFDLDAMLGALGRLVSRPA